MPEALRLLFICNEYPPGVHGGVGSFVYTLARRLALLGCQVHVLGYDQSVGEDSLKVEEGVSVSRLRSPFRTNRLLALGRYDLPRQLLERVVLSRRAAAYCRRHKIDLVESYDWSGPLWSRPGPPLVVRMHGAHTAYAFYENRRAPRFLRFIERRNLRLADHLVGVSEHISQVTLRAVALEGKHFRVVYNGVDTGVFKPLGLPRDPHQVLFAGTVSRRKGIYQLMQAMVLVFEQQPQAYLQVLGRLPQDAAQSQALIADLLSLLPESQRGRVRFAGAQPYPHMPRLYNQAACAVFPSLAEAFGFTCAEAMACGTPVVMTSRASGPELVEDGVSGLLSDPQNPKQLSQAILRYLSDDAFRDYVSTQAVSQISTKFNLDLAVSTNLSFYQEVI